MTRQSLLAAVVLAGIAALTVLIAGSLAIAAEDQAATTAAAAAGARETTTTPEGCTLEKYSIPSKASGRDIQAWVLLPPDYAKETEKRFPVLYCLHGRGAPYTVYSDMSRLRKAIVAKPMIVVGFSCDKAGWYIDATEKRDSQFMTFFLKELIPTIDKSYRTNPEARGVTGFSMGGFGAMLYSVAAPEMFVAASSLSGAFYPTSDKLKWVQGDFAGLLGDPAKNKAAYQKLDIEAGLDARLKAKKTLPKFFVACGTEDSLLPMSQQMRDFVGKRGLNCEYMESPGAHNWAYWHGMAETVVDFHWRALQADYKPIEHPAPASKEPAKAAQ